MTGTPALRDDAESDAVRHIAQFFDYAHLTGKRREVSSLFSQAAQQMINELPDSPELAAGLRKLLEAKDCFVRCVVDADRAMGQDH